MIPFVNSHYFFLFHLISTCLQFMQFTFLSGSAYICTLQLVFPFLLNPLSLPSSSPLPLLLLWVCNHFFIPGDTVFFSTCYGLYYLHWLGLLGSCTWHRFISLISLSHPPHPSFYSLGPFSFRKDLSPYAFLSIFYHFVCLFFASLTWGIPCGI